MIGLPEVFQPKQQEFFQIGGKKKKTKGKKGKGKKNKGTKKKKVKGKKH